MSVATHLSTCSQVKERKLLQSARVSTVCWGKGSIAKERGPFSGRSNGGTAAGVRFENEEFTCERKRLSRVQSKKWVRSREHVLSDSPR